MYECDTLILESRHRRLLCSPNLTPLAVGLLRVESEATEVVSHCCIDRYSNYILHHSAPIFAQHQHAPLKLHYMLAKWNKGPTFNGFGTQKETLTPSGVAHQIVSWSRWLQTMTFNFWFQSRESYQPLDYPHHGTSALESPHPPLWLVTLNATVVLSHAPRARQSRRSCWLLSENTLLCAPSSNRPPP